MKNHKSLQGTVSELFFQTYAISHKYTFVKGVSDYYVLDRKAASQFYTMFAMVTNCVTDPSSTGFCGSLWCVIDHLNKLSDIWSHLNPL